MRDNSFHSLVRIFKPLKILKRSYFREPKAFSIDSRKIKKGEAFIAIRGKFFDGHNFIKEAVLKGASLIVAEKEELIEKDYKVCTFIVRDTYRALANYVRYLRQMENPKVVAITGSVGKTTTKEMLAYLLEEDFKVLKNEKTENNFLGVSKSLLNLNNHDFFITELGTSRKGEIEELASIVKPDIGIITFIAPAHIEGLGTLQDVFEEKTSMFYSKKDMVGILNRDDRFLRKVNFCKKIFWFGKRKNSHLYARMLSCSERQSLFLINDQFLLPLNTPAYFFIYNALAAILTATILGMDLEDAVNKLKKFSSFPSMRMEKQSKKGMIFINDAYNSNPFSLKEGLKVIDGFSYPKVAVVGDMLELGRRSSYYHRLIAKEFLKHNFEHILTFGVYTSFLRDTLIKLGYRNVFHFTSHQDIADYLRKISFRKKYLVFLKGSRRMEMEKVIHYF